MTKWVQWPALAQCLQDARTRSHLTQIAMARRLGVTSATYSGYERGKLRPQPERLERLAVLLQLDPAELRRLAGYGPVGEQSPAGPPAKPKPMPRPAIRRHPPAGVVSPGITVAANWSRRGLGDHLRDLRLSRGYSLAKVAAAADCSSAFLSLVERGKARPAPERLMVIAEVLRVDVEELGRLAGYGGASHTTFGDD